MVNMAAEEQGLYGGGSAAGSVCSSDDEISVGCPSPGAAGDSHRGGSSSGGEEDSNIEERGDDYFKPLKRLKMMKIEQVSYSIGSAKKGGKRARPFARRQSTGSSNGSGSGVKSFSILDILNHRPAGAVSPTPIPPRGIVRPWDEAAAAAAVAVASAPPTLLLPPPPLLFSRPQSAETYETCSSGRSSTGGSDCCTSPDIMPSRSRHPLHHHRHPHSPQHRQHPSQHHGQGLPSRKHGGNKSEASPLDALFQMTSKTFEELNGESQEGQGSHMNMFSNRTQPKKKRKSRTAFTNHQIFELEKRFLYQKYLSPADRDEIAAQLGLSNAQVITWFQNRRAKLKRDMEELKKDVETAKVFVTQKSFLESVHSFSMLKKKPIASDDDKNVDK